LINSFSVRSAIYESIMQLLQFYEEAIADSLSKALHALYMLVSKSVSQKIWKISLFQSFYQFFSFEVWLKPSPYQVTMLKCKYQGKWLFK
jgi:hypothetical protein